MNKLTDIIKRYGIIGCLYKTIFKVVRMLGITYIKYLAYFKELPETIDTDTNADAFRKHFRFCHTAFRFLSSLQPQRV